MKWKSIETPPVSDGFYVVGGKGVNRKELSYSAKHNLWYDGVGKPVSIGFGYKWLDESAASITEDDVKDLDWEENVLSGRKTAYAANAKYEVLPLIGVFVLRITDYKTNGWGEEQFLTERQAIAEANRQNKEYILSQLK